MKPTRVAVFSAIGMLLTSVSVYSLTPPPGASRAAELPATPEALTPSGAGALDPQLARFTAGEAVQIEGRVGHPRIARGGRGETFLLLEARGARAGEARASAPVNLAIVMDRSGSMRGSRLQNAIRAATSAVDRLHDGDTVSVVTFDTRTALAVPPTEVNPGSRERIRADIRSITLGGDTCVSCGIEEGLAQIDRTMGKVNKIILLSDGDANSGIREIRGFQALGARARERGTPITSIGVDVDYNEKILSALSLESNGRHYFVENDAALARVFEAEAERLTETLASGAEVSLDLAPGVELDRVFERPFRRSGNRVIVSLGTLAAGEQKTVLVKVRLPAGDVGQKPIADIELAYRDIAGARATCTGKLGVEITASPADASDLDAVVAGRVQRSETASVLKTANDLFAAGRTDEANRALEAQEKALRTFATKAEEAAPAGRAGDVARDFEKQVAAVSEAQQQFQQSAVATATAAPAEPVAQAPAAGAPPPPAAKPARPQETREGKSAIKKNFEAADAFAD
jgi:Ca-activated chloride channel family protein